MTLSEDADIRKSPVSGNTMTFFNTASPAKPQTKKLNIPELPLQAKTRNETKHAMFLAPGSLVHKAEARFAFGHLEFNFICLCLYGCGIDNGVGSDGDDLMMTI